MLCIWTIGKMLRGTSRTGQTPPGHRDAMVYVSWAQPLMAAFQVWGCQTYGIMEVSPQISEEGLGGQEMCGTARVLEDAEGHL